MKVYTASGWLAASSASVATLATFEFVATAAQTVFTGNDANGASLSYVAPALIVTLNGVRLRPGDDYTATNGTSITLLSAAAASDELVVDAFGAFLIASVNGADIQDATTNISKLNATGTRSASTFLRGDNSFASVQSFAAGTALLFQQTAAPTGWTKVTTHNDKALRVVSGAASSGGSVAFSTAFASQAVSGSVGTSGATTLTTGQIPNHYHAVQTKGFASTLGIGVATGGGDGSWYGYGDTPEGTHDNSSPGGTTSATFANNDNGGGGSHTHSGGAFTGTAINLAVQYVDVIIATKD